MQQEGRRIISTTASTAVKEYRLYEAIVLVLNIINGVQIFGSSGDVFKCLAEEAHSLQIETGSPELSLQRVNGLKELCKYGFVRIVSLPFVSILVDILDCAEGKANQSTTITSGATSPSEAVSWPLSHAFRKRSFTKERRQVQRHNAHVLPQTSERARRFAPVGLAPTVATEATNGSGP
ncbi:hypothetical protein H0H92_009667 [Tricholoma furcatifolium]|nr:hypothetical protein H0H92_009667 [Tricholoma furcatifolium]